MPTNKRRKLNVAWKVVTKLRRESAMVDALYCPTYVLWYDINTIVTARPETLGVMVFETYKDAKRFTEDIRRVMIIKVRPIGRQSKPHTKIVSVPNDDNLSRFYRGVKVPLAALPHGTVCYKSVKVLT